MSTILPILTYKKKDGNIAVSNGKLTVVVMPENLKEVRATIRAEATTYKLYDDPRIDPDEWVREAARLCRLAEDLVSPESKVNIFDFIELTKAGSFPKNKNQLVATSKCRVGATYEYPVSRTLQLRLVPAYNGLWNWLEDTRMEDTMILKVDTFDSVRKQEPIFDGNGVPHKVVVAKARYLKDDQIVPGRVYEEKSGTQFLCITGCVVKDYTIDEETGKPHVYSGKDHSVLFPDKNCHGEPWNHYIRWTAALSKQVGRDTGYADILRALAAKDTARSQVNDKVSSRTCPRKFVREVCTLFDPADLTAETIVGKSYVDTWFAEPKKRHNEYHVLANSER